MIAWLACIAWGAESADWHVAQARQFIKRGWTLDADAEVRAGLAAFPGHLALNALCVELARARMDIARALDCAAAGVASRDGDLELRAELSRIEGWMQENFGFVALQGPDGTPRGRVAIRPVGLMLDPELKAAAAQVAQAAAAGTALPISVALPAGEYDIEGTKVRVEPRQITIVSLSPSAFAAKAGRGVRLELSAAGRAYEGPGLENQLPGGQFEFGLDLPAGAVRLGAAATWELRPYTRDGAADVVSPYGWGGKMRLSGEVELGTSILFQPAASVAVGQLPGIELVCTPSGEDLECSLGSSSGGEEIVYATGWMVAPGAELGLAHRVGRSVIGIRAGAAHVFGTVPTPGDVQREGRLGTYGVAEPVLHGWTGQAAFFYAFGL